jgi:pyruvate dehydrogenase E1 component beta subunit
MALSRMTYSAAAGEALAAAMRADERVVALGEDLGRGGVFGQYRFRAADGTLRTLQQEFGTSRVIDTPISEANIMGAAVGMALAGLRPVVEMRVIDFALCGMDELVNQAAKNRYMFGGQGRVPLVARMPIGLWSASAAQHSQSLEAWFAHIPGLVVACPATPQDNHGLLAAALDCGDPVAYLEHKELWGMEGEVDTGAPVPLGRARIARAGRDLTLVTWSRTLHESLAAASTLAGEGIEAEVIDLRTLWPWDREAVLASCAKTGRLLVAHEAVQAAGFGAEIAASVAEALGCPVRRLGAPRIPVGYAPTLESQARVGADRIGAAVRAFLQR